MEIYVGFIGFIGIVVGAIGQHFSIQRREDHRQKRQLGAIAYIDYLSAVSEIAFEPDKDMLAGIHKRLVHAKTRICLYGSSRAIGTLSNYTEMGSSFNTIKERAAWTEMIAAMRKDSYGEMDARKIDLEIISIGVEPPGLPE